MCKYVVVDLEMCNVSRGRRIKEFHWAKETMQIGAVLLDENFEIVKSFSTYVKPEFGRLDTEMKNFTGICYENLCNAPIMEEALKAFDAWIPEDSILVSWSDNDEYQLRREMQGKGIESEKLSAMLDTYIDCQREFSERLGYDRAIKLEHALIATDIAYEEGLHNALVDAHNTALLFAKMETEEELRLNPCFSLAHDGEVQGLNVSIGDMFSGIDLTKLVCA